MTIAPATIKTRIHSYRYDISEPEQAAAYEHLRQTLEARKPHCMKALGTYYMPRLDGREVELETVYLYNNQWNSAPIEGFSDKGYRLFDWAEECPSNKKIKQGHYLVETQEMVNARDNRVSCGYCGKQYDKLTAPKFCPTCIGSEYLKSTELHLTRVLGLGFNTKRPLLTPEESASLMPIYEAAQRGEGDERAKAAREKYARDVEQAYQKKTAELHTEYTAKKWLLAAGANMRILKDVIYYSHKELFTFGWLNKVDGADLDWLLAHLSEFPFEYTIKTVSRGEIGGRE